MLGRDDVHSNVVVDVGMAHGRESQAAVQSGLIVYGMHFYFFELSFTKQLSNETAFEPIPRNVEKVRALFKKSFADVEDLSQILTVFDCRDQWQRCTGQVITPPRTVHPTLGHCYLFVGAASDIVSKKGAEVCSFS